jgi:membrane dipeptidase
VATDNVFPIFDGHNDTLLDLALPKPGEDRSFFTRSEYGHLDLPRAREGGFGGGFFAVFVPSFPRSEDDELGIIFTEDGYEVPMAPPVDLIPAQEMALALVASLFRLEAASDGQMRVVRTADDLARCLREGVLAAVLHFEGAEAIDPDFDALEVFYQAGLRSLGLVWSRPNIFGHGVPFQFPRSPDTGPGLTEAGRDLVRACNRLRIMIDLSHLNEAGFWDVAALSDAPLVATHSAAHTLCPSTRNLTDRQLDAIRETGGMVGLTFTVSDLREDGGNDADTPLSTMVRHIRYLTGRVGIDGVGFGSDFDGTTVPAAIGDATGLPGLVAALRESGYNDAELRKLTHENWLRVLRATWGR